ncbi:MAG: AAA family ATPase, partial [Acidobacteriota bacterium]
MSPAHDIRFGPFRLDPPEGRLWQHDTPVPLTPKAFAVLHQLARQPGRRLDKDELLSAVWGERHVSDAVLKVAVREIRKALGDEARDPSYIETVHRHGYRFIAELSRPASSPDTAATLVGRRAELELLRNYRDRAFIGQRQVVFVTGEPGLGKTTLIDSFLAQQHDRLTASGHALEQFGGGEPYLPMLEALGRLSRGSHGNEVVDLLHRYAPTWLLQLPALLDPDARLELQHETRGATPERMLREMAEALEALTAVHPLILVLEDLQWSDYSTLDLIVRLARRPESARLLLLATFRPEEARRHDHPLHMLIRDLEPQPHCHNLRLDYLSTDAVANYLHARGPAPPTDRLAATIRAHTGGNPLFMTAVIDYLASQQRLVHERDRWRLRDQGGLGVPESIRQLIERQIDRLDDQDQQLLYTASVAGNEMSAIAIAHALSITLDEVEDRCDRLVNRRQFLRHAGVRKLPDRTITARYAFIHALHQHVLYERLSASRRSRLHRRIGHGGEATYGDRASDIAPELAHHFARAGDPGRAIHHLEHAAKLAARRHAAREAIGHLDHALKLANDLTDVEPACERLLLDRGLA